jgi:hypothetical protein
MRSRPPIAIRILRVVLAPAIAVRARRSATWCDSLRDGPRNRAPDLDPADCARFRFHRTGCDAVRLLASRCEKKKWRTGRDLNPRRLAPRRFSRPENDDVKLLLIVICGVACANDSRNASTRPQRVLGATPCDPVRRGASPKVIGVTTGRPEFRRLRRRSGRYPLAPEFVSNMATFEHAW